MTEREVSFKPLKDKVLMVVDGLKHTRDVDFIKAAERFKQLVETDVVVIVENPEEIKSKRTGEVLDHLTRIDSPDKRQVILKFPKGIGSRLNENFSTNNMTQLVDYIKSIGRRR